MTVFWNCIGMNTADIEEGILENEYIFADDALDYELHLADTTDVEFTQELNEPLTVGSHILFTGTPHEELPWFVLNLGVGSTENKKTTEIAVHFNVRMAHNYVVRNTKKKNVWGTEETTSFTLFPFKFGRQFNIEVLVDEKQTLFAVDGEHYCNFAHRNPSPLTATWVQVTGIRDAALQVTRKCEVYPTLAPEPLQVPTRCSLNAPREPTEPIWGRNPVCYLNLGIDIGQQIVMYGKLRAVLHTVTFDLMEAAARWPRGECALHVSLRAHGAVARQLVVTNARRAGAGAAWGSERRQRSAQLVPGTRVTFRIIRNENDWAILANNMLIGDLEHRLSPDNIKALRITGDFFPEDIYLCDSESKA